MIKLDVLEFLREQAVGMINTAEDNQLVARAKEALVLLEAREILANSKQVSKPLGSYIIPASIQVKKSAPIQQFQNVSTAARLAAKKASVHTVTQPIEEPKTVKEETNLEDLATRSINDTAIKNAVKKLKQPFNRHDIYRELRWAGVNDLPEAVVGEWIKRASKNGYIRSSGTVGEYFTKNYTAVRIVSAT